MIAIDATKKKLDEAAFFYRKLAEVEKKIVQNEPAAFDYYLSAFLSAARSVTLVLEVEQSDKYKAWFPSWVEALSNGEKALFKHFNAQRVAVVHRTGADVEYESQLVSMHKHLMDAARQGVNIVVTHRIPGTPQPEFIRTVRTFDINGRNPEVVPACRQQLTILTKLLTEFAAAYPD